MDEHVRERNYEAGAMVAASGEPIIRNNRSRLTGIGPMGGDGSDRLVLRFPVYAEALGYEAGAVMLDDGTVIVKIGCSTGTIGAWRKRVEDAKRAQRDWNASGSQEERRRIEDAFAPAPRGPGELPTVAWDRAHVLDAFLDFALYALQAEPR